MIDPKAEPIGHRSPYKRIDLSRPKPKEVITRKEVVETDKVPDPELYDYCHIYDIWKLKDKL